MSKLIFADEALGEISPEQVDSVVQISGAPAFDDQRHEVLANAAVYDVSTTDG